MAWFPYSLPGHVWQEPAISHLFWAEVIVLGMALWRLHEGAVGLGEGEKTFHREEAQGAKAIQ
jgi:hypothetical protein